MQAGLGPAVAAVFLQPSEFGENLETSTLQNAVNDPQQPPEDLTAQYVSEVQQHMYISFGHRAHPLSGLVHCKSKLALSAVDSSGPADALSPVDFA